MSRAYESFRYYRPAAWFRRRRKLRDGFVLPRTCTRNQTTLHRALLGIPQPQFCPFPSSAGLLDSLLEGLFILSRLSFFDCDATPANRSNPSWYCGFDGCGQCSGCCVVGTAAWADGYGRCCIDWFIACLVANQPSAASNSIPPIGMVGAAALA